MSSRLLLDENPLLIMPKLACIIGLNESIVLQQIHYWIKINEKAKINFHDGFTWTYNSYKEWQEQFPFWSVKTIQRTINSLETQQLIIIGNYNKMKIDRTKWYRINHEKLENLEKETEGQNDLTKECSSGQNDLTKKTECPHEEVNLTKAIPETTTKITTKTNNIEGSEDIREGTTIGSTPSIPFYDFLLQDIKRYKTEYKSEIVESIIYYYGKYQETFNKEHFRYTKEQLKEIYSRLDTLYSVGIYGEEVGNTFPIDIDEFKALVDRNFEVNYSGDMSYTLLSFLNDKVLMNRYWEVWY